MPTDATQEIDPDRLQHDSEYRTRVIQEIADRFLEKAEEQDYDTTYEKIASEHPSFTDEVSTHVEAKVESLVEQEITKERLRRGKIQTGLPRREDRPASSGGSSETETGGVEVGQIVSLPTN